MCLIVFAWRVHPDYPLVVAANRDEYRHRPARAAHWWDDAPGVLAGRDLEAGGTWMGITRSGRFAALTNYRDPRGRRESARSRGLLVRDALADGADAAATLKAVAGDSALYPGFNLLVGDGRTLGVHESASGSVRLLEPGVYGLSNALLDTPWPKLATARARLAAALASLPDAGAVLALLRDDAPAPDHLLPDTGVGLDVERRLSPAFLRDEAYGTRCSSLILMRADGRARLREWTWGATAALESTTDHGFAIRR